MAEFILGNINQGAKNKPQGLWRPGDIIDAYETHIMFFTGLCRAANFLDLSGEVARDLKMNRRFHVCLDDIITLGGETRLARLKCASFDDKKMSASLIMQLCGRDLEEQDIFGEMTMTLPEGSSLNEGVELSIGYISVLEPLGEGQYRLHHDYPLQHRSGPRYEFFEDDHETR